MKSRIRVTKIFTFEMAHALEKYDGPCKNIHGHSYRLQVTVAGYPKENINDPKNGMVIDFGDLKKIVETHIIQKFDHAIVLGKNADTQIIKALSTEQQKLVLTDYTPTSENLLLDFVETLMQALNNGGNRLVSVILSETASSYVEWKAEDYLAENEA